MLDFGRLDALIHVAEFQTQGLLVDYQKTIVVAVAKLTRRSNSTRPNYNGCGASERRLLKVGELWSWRGNGTIEALPIS